MITTGTTARWLLPAELVNRSLADPLAWFELERTNLVAAVEAAAANGLEESAWELAGCLTSFFLMRSYWLAWDHVQEVVLAACRQAGNRRGEAAALTAIGYAMSSAERLKDHPDDGQAMLLAAIEIFRDLGDRRGEAKALHALAELLKRIGIFQAPTPALQAAIDYATQSLHLARMIGDPSIQADALLTLGAAYRYLGRQRKASPALEEARRLTLPLGARHGQAMALWHLAMLARNTGKPRPPVPCSNRALTWSGAARPTRTSPAPARPRPGPHRRGRPGARPTSCWRPRWPPGRRTPNITAFARRPWMDLAGFAAGSSATTKLLSSSPRRLPGGES